VVRMKTLLRVVAALAALIFLFGCEDSLLLNSLKVDKHRTVILTDAVVSDISMTTDTAGNGNVYVAWKNAQKQVKFVRSLDKGATWDPAVIADGTNGVAGRTRITGMGLNSIAIVSRSGGALRCATSDTTNGTTWNAATITGATLASYDDSVSNFSLTNQGATPVIIYNNPSGQLKAFALSSASTPATWNDYPALAVNTLDAGSGAAINGVGNSFVAGSLNKLYAGYQTNRSSGGGVQAASYTGTWSRGPIQQRGTQAPSGDTAIGVGNGKVYLAYAWEPDHQIWIAQAADILAPSPPLLDIYTGTGPISSIRITVPGEVFVAFYDQGAGSIMLVYSRDQGVTWSAPVTVEDGLAEQEFGFLGMKIPVGTANSEAVGFVYKALSSDGVSQDLVFTWIDKMDLP
jgi:hypothetical protein